MLAVEASNTVRSEVGVTDVGETDRDRVAADAHAAVQQRVIAGYGEFRRRGRCESHVMELQGRRPNVLDSVRTRQARDNHLHADVES